MVLIREQIKYPMVAFDGPYVFSPETFGCPYMVVILFESFHVNSTRGPQVTLSSLQHIL